MKRCPKPLISGGEALCSVCGTEFKCFNAVFGAQHGVWCGVRAVYCYVGARHCVQYAELSSSDLTPCSMRGTKF